MNDIYRSRVYIVVQSKYPEILKEFKETFEPTTEKFKNLHLEVLDGDNYGAKAINPIIKELGNKLDYFGVFNDDLWFADGWLEDSLNNMISDCVCVSSGYVETTKREVFEKAVEITKNENGSVLNLYGANAVFDMKIFKKIGYFDERFTWSSDDLDWAWRVQLNKMMSITLKRIRVGHYLGRTRERDRNKWRKQLDEGKFEFWKKHGYDSYRIIRNQYKQEHGYFTQFR